MNLKRVELQLTERIKWFPQTDLQEIKSGCYCPHLISNIFTRIIATKSPSKIKLFCEYECFLNNKIDSIMFEITINSNIMFLESFYELPEMFEYIRKSKIKPVMELASYYCSKRDNRLKNEIKQKLIYGFSFLIGTK